MLRFYQYFFPAVWVVFLLYWQIEAVRTKSAQRVEPASSRILRALIFSVAILLIAIPDVPVFWLDRLLWPQGLLPFWAGAAVTVVGLLFAVWARVHLGRNWSSAVTIKKDHELIRTGPYGVVRHPIYTGILVGFLGTAIALSQVRGFVASILVFVALWLKLRMEEQWMRSLFGDTYDDYAQHTSALIPYLF